MHNSPSANEIASSLIGDTGNLRRALEALTRRVTALEQQAAQVEPAAAQPCWCHKCNEGRLVNGVPFAMTQMIVCPICGNKRCPHASDHALACTASNDPIAAPAAAQAEPCIGSDPVCPCQDGDACHYRDTATTKAWPIPQAEPKREPPPEFIAWVRDNLPVSTIIANPDWWAPRLWRAAMHAHGITGDSNAE